MSRRAFVLQCFLRNVKYPTINNTFQHRTLATAATSETSSKLNNQEVQKFEKMAADWWNPEGNFKALHSMNSLRVELIRNGFMNNGQIGTVDTEFPMKGLKILDIGCGGGILSQPLGRLGAHVTGIDAGMENIIAARHNLAQKLSSNVQFVCSSLEEYAAAAEDEQFDGVVASEVIEHVSDPRLFLQLCTQLLKPSGSIFVTTINRTQLAWLGAIVAAEYVLRIVPPGTHDWKKFLAPEEIQNELRKHNCNTRLIHGMQYNVLCNTWSWTKSTAVNFALHAVKDSTVS